MERDSRRDSKPTFERSAKKESESKSLTKLFNSFFNKTKKVEIKESRASRVDKTSRASRASGRSRVEETDKEDISIIKKIFRPIGLVLSIILTFIVIMNLTIILKSYIKPDKVPSFLGVKLFIVETNSMQPHFSGGDIIFVKNVEPKILEEGDVISYSDSRSIVTHRIIGIEKTDDGLSFTTKGDGNDAEDLVPITEENVEGRYWFRVEKMGRLAMYVQSPQGRLIFIGIPVAIFIIYDIVQRKDRQNKARIDDMKKEREIKNLEKELKRREK